MPDTSEAPDPFVTKRVRLTSCYDHIPVGGNRVLDKVWGQDLPRAMVRDKWEHILWCDSCRQWVATKPGCVDRYN
jgi:hypothetical protein